jgi:hypothetical protein
MPQRLVLTICLPLKPLLNRPELTPPCAVKRPIDYGRAVSAVGIYLTLWAKSNPSVLFFAAKRPISLLKPPDYPSCQTASCPTSKNTPRARHENPLPPPPDNPPECGSRARSVARRATLLAPRGECGRLRRHQESPEGPIRVTCLVNCRCVAKPVFPGERYTAAPVGTTEKGLRHFRPLAAAGLPDPPLDRRGRCCHNRNLARDKWTRTRIPGTPGGGDCRATEDAPGDTAGDRGG